MDETTGIIGLIYIHGRGLVGRRKMTNFRGGTMSTKNEPDVCCVQDFTAFPQVIMQFEF